MKDKKKTFQIAVCLRVWVTLQEVFSYSNTGIQPEQKSISALEQLQKIKIKKTTNQPEN